MDNSSAGNRKNMRRKLGEKEMIKNLKNNTYPGRGIIIGQSRDGENAVIAYFIMGRSENSRNRIFVLSEDGIKTQAFDPAKLSDPSLIIYSPVRAFKNKTIVTNGDQTDTVYNFIKDGKTFEEALRTRAFEPDAPNFTPRISGIVTVENGGFSYKMSILKASENGNICLRQFFEYEKPMKGIAHFIHTYEHDGNPIPSFSGEPKKITVSGGIEEFTSGLWNTLDDNNKVSLFVRYINLKTHEETTRIINKNE